MILQPEASSKSQCSEQEIGERRGQERSNAISEKVRRPEGRTGRGNKVMKREMAALKLKNPVREGQGVGRVRGEKSFLAFGKWQRQAGSRSNKIRGNK